MLYVVRVVVCWPVDEQRRDQRESVGRPVVSPGSGLLWRSVVWAGEEGFYRKHLGLCTRLRCARQRGVEVAGRERGVVVGCG